MGQEPDLKMLAEIRELQSLLREEWPARHAALKASGVPLMDADDDDDDGDGGDDDDGGTGGDDSQKPPWGDDDDFDPERAWKLIQKLRASDKTQEVERLRAELKRHEDSQKTDAQKLEERATTAEQTAAAATREAARLRVALRKNLTEAQARRLVGDTEEELEADADELLASFKQDDDGAEPQRRPRERLRPGAVRRSSDDDDDENDPAKLAALVPRV